MKESQIDRLLREIDEALRKEEVALKTLKELANR